MSTQVAADVPAHLWRAESLGELGELDLAHGRLQYFRRGAGPVLVFAHGWLTNANLWRNVVERLADRFTCIALDLPFGAHRLPMKADADLTPDGCGALIASAVAGLDVEDVTLVGNDSGGAYAQVAVAAQPERVARLVLNSSEGVYSEFPPEAFRRLPEIAQDPAALGQVFEALRDRELRASPAVFGLLAKHPLDDAASDSYALAALGNPGVLRDVSKVMASAATAPVRDAGRRLIAGFDRPVLFAWGPEDLVFPIADAERYAAALADGRLVRIEDAYSFTPEDQPGRLAAEIARFAGG